MSHLIRSLSSTSLIVAAVAMIHVGLGCHLMAAPAVTATKSDETSASTKVAPGSTVTYTTRIANGGADPAMGVVLKDPEVTGTTFVGNSLSVTPVAVDDTFDITIIPNTTVSSGTFSVVDNDLPGYVSDAAVSKTALTISDYDTTTTNSGTVSMTTTGAEVGRFTYSPRPGFTGTDTFTYTVSNTVPNGPSGSITATVKLTVAGNVIWFVDTTAPSNGNGTLGKPFNVLTGLLAAINGSAAMTDRVYIHSANSSTVGNPTVVTLSSGLALPANTILVGRGTIGANFQSVMGVTYPPITQGTAPSINGVSPTLTRSSGGDTITLGQNNVITGVSITNTGGGYAVAGAGINTCQIGSTAAQISAAGSNVTHDTTLSSSGSSTGSLFLDGGNGAVIVNAPINSTAGRSVRIDKRSGSTVTISCPVVDSRQGISLDSNSGATISFTGGLALSTASNVAFSATRGGTVTATQNNSSILNTISTTTGRALNVTDTIIGASGLTFQSISSNGSDMAVNLSSTGSVGGLTVTGTGSQESGGTIQNTTGNSIRLIGTANVLLSNVLIKASKGHGIFGTEVNGFILSGSKVENCGDESVENGVRFASSDINSVNETGLYGSATSGANPTRIINSTVSGSSGNNLEIVNFGAKGLPYLSIENCTFQQSVNGAGMQIEIRGSEAQANVSTINVVGCTFARNFSQGVDGQALDDSSLTINVGTSQFTDNAEGIVLANSYSADLTYDIDGNRIDNSNASPRSGPAIACVNGTSSTSAAIYKGKVRNNIINTGGIDNNGLAFYLAGAAISTLQLHNNTVTVGPNANFEGVFLQVGESGGSDDTVTGNLTVTSNKVSVEGATGGNGMLIQSRFSATMKAHIAGNICEFGQGGDSGIRIRQRDKSRVELPGYTGTSFDATAVVNFLKSNNPSTSEITATSNDNGDALNDGYFNGSAVILPLTYTPGGINRVLSAPPEPAPVVSPGESISDVEVAGTPSLSSLVAPPVEPAPLAALSAEHLESTVAEAITRWEATGLTADQLRRLRSLKFEVADLAHNHLGEAAGDIIRLDPTGGRRGWFVDADSESDRHFGKEKSATRRETDAASAPAGRVDLLTTVMHEMGHALGLPDSYHPADRESIMFGLLMNGERRYPAMNQAKGAVPLSTSGGHFLTGGLNPLALGNLPPGKEVVVTYQVKVANPAMASSISAQGTVTGSNFADVLTDDLPGEGDPALPGASDPTVTLLDLPKVSVAVSVASLPEDIGELFTYTFTRTGPTTVALPVSFTLTGTAVAGTDYTVASFNPASPEPAHSAKNLDAEAGTFDFAVGQSIATFVVIPAADTAVENNETVIANVAVGAAYEQGTPASATGTITNDDIAVALTLPATSRAEDAGVGLSYTFTRTGLTTGTSVATFTVSGTATFDTDYTVTGATSFNSSAGSVTFGTNETEKVVTVTPVADNIVEAGGETVDMTLTVGSGYVVEGTALQSGTILDDDSTVTIAVAPSSVSEDSNAALSYTVTRSGPSDNELAVYLRVSGTAALTGDYTNNFTTFNSSIGAASVTIPAGSSSKTVDVVPSSDAILESNETVILTLSANGAPAITGGYEVGTPASATGTIEDDDLPMVAVTATNPTAVEGGTQGIYRFTRNDSEGELTAKFRLHTSSTADGETDFTLSGTGVNFDPASGQGTVVFPDTVAAVEVKLSATQEAPIMGGQAAEADETVRLDIVPEANVYLGTSNATVTISANGFIVVSTLDAGEGSLRQAIANANAIPGVDTISFSDGSGGTVNFTDEMPEEILLTSGELLISSDLSIISPETAELRIARAVGAPASRVIQVGEGTTVELTGLAIVNGSGAGGLHTAADSLNLSRCVLRDNLSSGNGGGLYVSKGGVALSDCILESNRAEGSGGAFLVEAGSARFVRCRIQDNTAQSGGAGHAAGGEIVLVSCSVNNNTADTSAGGLQIDAQASSRIIGTTLSGNAALSGQGGALSSNGTLTLANATITDNSASSGAGGILLLGGAAPTISNTIISGNAAAAGVVDVSGAVNDGGNNLIGIIGGSSGFGSSSISGLDAKLGPLANNGGNTLTHALLDGSPAINAGSSASIPADTYDLDGDGDITEPLPYDQRGAGFLRAIGAADIGAFEVQKSLYLAAAITTVSEGANTAQFSVSRTGVTENDVSVSYTVAGGATNPVSASDFGSSFPSGTLTIAAGESTATITIPIVDDAIVELDEAFVVTLSDPTDGYLIADGSVDMQIADNDSATISVAKVADGAETNPVATDGSFLVTQSAVASTATTVHYTLAGTAGSGTDYTALSGSLTIPAGETTATIPIAVIRDFVVEGDEEVLVTLSLGSTDEQITLNAAADSATLTIIDNAPASIAVNAGSSQSTVVNTAFATRLVAVVNDADGNPLQGAQVTFKAPVSGASGIFSGNATVSTDAAGLATSPVFTANTTSGGYTVTAESIGTPANFQLNNSPGAATQFTLVAPEEVAAGTAASMTVTARDTFGNAATAYSGVVHFTATDSLAQLPANTSLTAGTGTFQVTFITGGSHTVTAVDTVNSAISGTSGAMAVTPVADLAVTVSDGVSTAAPGSHVTYTVTVSNAGPSPVLGASVSDEFPSSVTAVWSGVGSGGGTGPVSGNGDIDALVNLPAGGSFTFTATAAISSDATGTLTNTATIIPPAGTTDPVESNNSATDTDTLIAESDISVAITNSPDPVDAGSNITYSITLINSGPSVAPSVEISNVLPADTSFVSLSGPVGWSSNVPAVGSSGSISTSASNLPAGTYQFTLVVKVDYIENGAVLSSTVTASTTAVDPQNSNNSDSATTTVRAIPEIAVLSGGTPLSSGVGLVSFGDTTVGNPVSRTLTVRNIGTGDLVLSNIVPPTGFSVTTLGVSSRTIRPTDSFDIVISYDAPTVGTSAGNVTLSSNDTDEATFLIPVSGTRNNVAPVATPPNVVTDEDTEIMFGLAGSDADGDPLSYTIVTPPTHGSLSIPSTGSLVGGGVDTIYIPSANYNGADSFTYKVNDGSVDSVVVTVAITINEVNDLPTVVAPGIADITLTRPGLTATVAFEEHFTDVETASADLDYLTAWAADPEVFSAVRTGNSTAFTGTAPGSKVVTVTAVDSQAGSVQEFFRVTVKSVPAIANGGIPATVLSPAAPPQTVDLTSYFADQDGDALAYSIVGNSDPSKATPSISGGSLLLAPAAPGDSTLTIRATDVDNNHVDHSFVVTVEEPIPGLDPSDPASPPVLNLQTGLYEVRVTATNTNVFAIPGFRLRVTSVLPEGMRLQNSTGPIGENAPYVDVLTHLEPGDSMTVVLEFYSLTRNYQGFAPTIVAESLPADLNIGGTGEGFEVVSRFVVQNDRSVVIEFASVAGRYYQVEYSSDLVTWKKSLVPIQAGANFTQWVDRGAPNTDAHPSTISRRFYRISEISK